MAAPDQTDGPACPTPVQLEAVLRGGASEHVSRHVDGCASCGEQLESMRANEALFDRLVGSDLDSSSVDGGTGGAGVGPASRDALPGYEIVEEIFRGGQGVVYRAIQLATKRTVALKVLGAGAFATTRQRRRFEREVDLIAALRHPHIVTVYDSGVTDDGGHWFAMEHIDGLTLDAWMSDEAARPTLAGLLKLFATICQALSYAHQRGVIHRDLKPGNIMVDATGGPHVVDFGLARPVDPELRGVEATVTREGAFLGTIAYASPEQSRGDQTLVDVRSDVYALGVIAYELLAGRFPYPVEGAMSAVLDAIVSTPPRPLRGRGDTRYAVDDELETIVLKALAKEPERRYQSAAALERDVRHYLAGEAIEAKRDSARYVLRKTLARHKVAVAVASTFVGVLVVATVALTLLNRRLMDEKDKLAAVNIFLEDTLGSVEGASGQQKVTVYELLAEGEEWIEMVLSDEPDTEAAVREIIGNGFRNIGEHDRADAQLRAALEIRRRERGDGHPEVARSLTALALLRRDERRYDEAETLLRRSLAIRLDRFGSDHISVAWNLSTLASVREAAGDLEEAETLLRRSLAIRRRLRPPGHPDVAMALFRIAEVRAARHDDGDAIRLHRDALAMRRAALDERHPDLPRSMLALARLLMDTGDAEAALPLLEEAVEKRRMLRGDDHWRVAEARSMLGACLSRIGRTAEARAVLEESHAALKAVLGDDDPATRRARAWLDELAN